jgi:cell wall-associated NlpC family hydrolase
MRWIRAAVLGVAILAAVPVTAGAQFGLDTDQLAANAALGEVGAPYTWGGATASAGFDSSGLVVWAYAQEGIRLPHSSQALYALKRARHIARRDLRRGDLVFFDDTGHVGIYLGNGMFVHSPHTGATVVVQPLAAAGPYSGAVRIGPLR